MKQHRVHIDQKGLERVRASLIRKHMRRAVTIAARPIRTNAKAISQEHRRRGFLGRSIGMKVRTFESGVAAIIGPDSSKAFTFGKVKQHTARPALYAHFLEAGSKKQRATPIFGRAFTENQMSFRDRVSKEFWSSIENDISKA